MRKLYFLPLLLLGLSAGAQVQINIYDPLPVCNPGDCVMLEASAPTLHATDNYTVTPVPFSPLFPFTGGITIPPSSDDQWSATMNLPFNFSFYGTFYNQILVGTNGVVTFDLVNQVPMGGCNWNFNQSIPNTNFVIKNAIYGVYQDTDIRTEVISQDGTPDLVQNVNYYVLDTGANAAPNRVFVANFNELPQFQCNSSAGLQTSQIVLHEGTNIIEIFIKSRTSCTSWNSGSGLIGLQNATGTMAIAPPGRNTGTWATTNEAWRFTPAGAAIAPTISWYQNGIFLTNDNPANVCPTETTSISVQAAYPPMSLVVSDEIAITPVQNLLGQPQDLLLCTDDLPPYAFDLTVNQAVALGAENPDNYIVRYYTNLADAQNLAPNNIPNPNLYSVVSDTTIYMSLENYMETGCIYVRPFDIEINPVPAPPTGDATQTFTPGQTLSNLVVNGQNIQWYDHPTAGNLLPANTPLVNNTTYYASQSIGGCESRMLPERLPVMVTATLGVAQFTAADLKLYPNPAESTLTVAFPENINKSEIFNTLGQLVLVKNANSNEVKLDISTLNSGNYFVKVYSGEQTTVTRFIKK